MNARRLLPLPLLLIAVTIALAAPSSASAASLPTLGVADNNIATLRDPRFKAFGIRRLRVTVPWNIYLRPNGAEAQRVNRVIDRAQNQGISVLASFTLGNFRSKRARGRLVGIKSYTRMFKRFHRRQRDVKEIIPWNEVNHRFQPTRTRRGARQAALYYRAVKRSCRGCTVLGATVLDEKNVVTWLNRFKRALRRLRVRQPRIWGLHAYKGVERSSTKPVRTVLRNVRGQVWIVESGGLFKHSGRKPKLRQSGARQARQNRFLFNRIANNARLRKRIRRIYIYNWIQANQDNSWDSAQVGPDYARNLITPITGLKLRPAFFVLQAEAQKRPGFRGPAIFGP